MTFDEVLTRFHAKPNGNGYKAHCPVHKDDKESLAISLKDGKILVHCHAGCDKDAVLDAVGLTMKDLFEDRERSPIVATYLYRDIDGGVRYRKQRTADKQFFFARPDGQGGWIESKKQNGGAPVMQGIARLLYRLNELRGHSTVYIVEGEKDADRLWSVGLPATTNDVGASQDLRTPKWTDALTQQLKAVGVITVVCLPDNDDPGRAHIEAAARSCTATGIEARIVALPGLSAKGDVSDWFDAGHSKDELMSLGQATPCFSLSPRVEIENLPAFLLRMQSAPEPIWLIPGLIPDEGTTLWHGQPRDFKTMCALEVALALASGRAAFTNARFQAAHIVPVAYFSEEDPERLVAARLHWLTVKTGIPTEFYPFIRKSLSFDTEDDREFIMRMLLQTQVRVVFFDPVRSYTGLSDKGPSELRPVTVFIRRIQNETTAKTVSLIHHDTKPLAVESPNGSPRSRSQQASGGGIFSISDCPVSFTKVAWNKVAVFPEDYKLSGDPKPFEVTFETEVRDGDEGPRFGSWIRPVAVTKVEKDIVDGVAVKKILDFLQANAGEWYVAPEVESGAHIRKDTAAPILKRLLTDRLVRFVTGDEAKALGRSPAAKLWSAVPAVALPYEGQL